MDIQVRLSRLVWATFLFAAIPAALSAQSFAVIEYPTPGPAEGIAQGADGAMWFTGSGIIGKVDGNGAITSYTIPSGSEAYGIALGPDGALWFTTFNGQTIGRVTTGGVITEFPVPGNANGEHFILDITAGPDGAMWFAYSDIGLGRITPDGSISIIPSAQGILREITLGPDGAFWLTANNASILRITLDGQVTSHQIPAIMPIPEGITTGPDGALWFTESWISGPVGRITTEGKITQFGDLEDAGGITVGPDGALWAAGASLYRINPDATISELPIPTGSAFQIANGPEGLWFTEGSNNRVGRVVLQTASLTATPPSTNATGTYNFQGSGFASGEAVQLFSYVEKGPLALGTATADESGSFQLPVNPPFTASGPHSITAFGENSGRLGVTQVSVTPSLAVRPAKASPGSPIRVIGFGFSYDYINVYFDGAYRGMVYSTPRGDFWGPNAFETKVPAEATPGVHTITAEAVNGNFRAETSIIVQ